MMILTVLCAKLIIIITSNELVVIRQNILFLMYHVNFFYLCNIKVRISVTITVKTQLMGQNCH